MQKKIEICSNALLFLGHNPISSFDEPGAGPLLCKNLYESTYKDFLSSTNWNFAKRFTKLNRLAERPEHPEYQYTYQLPNDFLRLDSTIPVQHFEIMEDKVYANSPTLEIEYAYMVREELLPAYAIKAMEILMASTLAVPLTRDSQMSQMYFNLYQRYLLKAGAIDSQNDPSTGFHSTPVLDVRFG